MYIGSCVDSVQTILQRSAVCFRYAQRGLILFVSKIISCLLLGVPQSISGVMLHNRRHLGKLSGLYIEVLYKTYYKVHVRELCEPSFKLQTLVQVQPQQKLLDVKIKIVNYSITTPPTTTIKKST